MLTVEKTYQFIKKTNVLWLWGIAVYCHTYLYVPYLKKELSTELTKELTDTIFDRWHDEVSFKLQLSEASGVPMNKIHHKLGSMITWNDSIKKFYPKFLKYDQYIDVGIKASGDEIYYLTTKNKLLPVFVDQNNRLYLSHNNEKIFLNGL